MSRTANFQALRQAVIAASVGDRWKNAVLEWEVTSVEEHPTSDGECVCGQTNLLWMYTIENTLNNNHLFPIGSTCVNHFERADLNQQVSVLRRLVTLRSAARKGERITVDKEWFSRATLDYLLDHGAFTPDQYNRGDGYYDWEFLRKVFGKRDKGDLSSKQLYRARMLVQNKIIPFVLDDTRIR